MKEIGCQPKSLLQVFPKGTYLGGQGPELHLSEHEIRPLQEDLKGVNAAVWEGATEAQIKAQKNQMK